MRAVLRTAIMSFGGSVVSGGGRSVASRTHRVSAFLAWGCALFLGIGLSGCASFQDTGVSDPTGHVRFTVPDGWRQIGASALAAELKSTTGGAGGAWTVA